VLSSYESCAPASASSASMTSRTRPRIEYCVPVGAFFCDHAVHGSRLLSANNRVFCLVDVLARRFRPAPFVGWPRQSVLVWFARACGVMIKQSLMVGSFVLLLAISWTSSSLARVECKGDFQVTKYGLIATPWCEEENIAVVARSYGWTVTGSEVRKNPLKKVYICQVLGRDIRLKGSCAGYSPDAYAPGR
jgi:hypothetical protein